MRNVYICVLFAVLFTVSCEGEVTTLQGFEVVEIVKEGNVGDLKSYLSNNGDPNATDKEGNSLLLISIMENEFETYKTLLQAGANPNFRNGQGDPRHRLVVMEQASIAESNNYLKEAIKFGANPNTLGSYAKYGILFQAITSSKLQNVKVLIESGADIDEVGINSFTPIHQAIAVKNFDIVYYLLDKGADLTIKNDWGYTPIDTIKMFGDAGIGKGSEYYMWYLKVLEKLDITPESIAKKRKSRSSEHP